MSEMRYKTYSARVEYDDDDRVLHGRIVGIADVVSFHAKDVDGLRHAFEDAVDDYIATCAKIGKVPQRTYSGRLMLRIDPETHAKAAIAAQLSGKSLNQWGEEALAAAAGRLDLEPSPREGRLKRRDARMLARA